LESSRLFGLSTQARVNGVAFADLLYNSPDKRTSATLALLILGFGGVGAMLRARRAQPKIA
jgi:hypothetical protein